MQERSDLAGDCFVENAMTMILKCTLPSTIMLNKNDWQVSPAKDHC